MSIRTANLASMDISRRTFLQATGAAGLGIAFSGSAASLLANPAGALTAADGPQVGYGPLRPDPAGLLDLPQGFRYKVFSRHQVDTLSTGEPVPADHDGMGSFADPRGRTLLVRNHELSVSDITGGKSPVPQRPGMTYDPAQPGGTTTLLLSGDNTLLSHTASLAGTIRNCAGGITPWGTWLTCEETEEFSGSVPHGYVFEVDPIAGGDPRPITGMGRFPHEAVAIDPRTGVAYLTEDASNPFGYVYRYLPNDTLGRAGSLHRGGRLQAMVVPGVAADLSEIDTPGTVVKGIRWVDVGQADPPQGTSVRTTADATRIQKAEGCWWAKGSLFFVSSFGTTTVKTHQGQVFRYDPVARTLTLVAQFGAADPFDGPDNITIAPFGTAFLCEDGDGEQFVVGLTGKGVAFPFARNALNESEFAGACFSPDARTMYFNIQEPGLTFAVRGPWTA